MQLTGLPSFFLFSINQVTRCCVGLARLENLNLSFTVVSDGSLRKLSGLTSLKSLNLDSRQITDAGLEGLTGKKLSYKCSSQHMH